MHYEKTALLKKIQTLEFCAFEIALFLDTHPCNTEALKDHKSFSQELAELKKLYSERYGPLTHESHKREDCWLWAEEPWPWEIEYEGGN
ncbi:MAG: spore coat protein CotJB [Bacillota bacterium]